MQQDEPQDDRANEVVEQQTSKPQTAQKEEEEEHLTEEARSLLEDERSCVFETRVDRAAKCQEIGSQVFRNQQLKKAIQWYERALFHVDFDEGTWYFELLDKHRDLVNQVRLPVYLNLAACFLSDETKDLARAIENSSLALQIESNNTKALFRHGKAQLLRGNYDDARSKLKQAAENAPTDRAIRQCLKLLAEKSAEQKAKEKNVWGGKLKAKEQDNIKSKQTTKGSCGQPRSTCNSCSLLCNFRSWQMVFVMLVIALVVGGLVRVYSGQA